MVLHSEGVITSSIDSALCLYILLNHSYILDLLVLLLTALNTGKRSCKDLS